MQDWLNMPEVTSPRTNTELNSSDICVVTLLTSEPVVETDALPLSAAATLSTSAAPSWSLPDLRLAAVDKLPEAACTPSEMLDAVTELVSRVLACWCSLHAPAKPVHS